MSPEALALKVIGEMLIEYGDDVVIAIVGAITDAFDGGKGEAEALAAARAHMPPRIDTTREDEERRRRIAARHGFEAATVSVLTPPRLPVSARIDSALAGVRRLSETIALSHEDREDLRVVLDAIDPRP